MEGEGIKTIVCPDDPVKQDRLFEQLEELQRKLWDEHLSTLTTDERRQFSQGTHPSQSHSQALLAQPILEEFRRKIAHVPYIATVALGAYHGDRLVISVHFSEDIPRKQWKNDLPTYFRGFEIKAGFPQKLSQPPNGAERAVGAPQRWGDRIQRDSELTGNHNVSTMVT